MSTVEALHEWYPYDALTQPAAELAISSDATIRYSIYRDAGAKTLEQAASDFEQFGVAVLDPRLVLPSGETLIDRIRPVAEASLATIKEFKDDATVLAPKNYEEETYKTTRRLTTVAPDMVEEHFGEVVELQRDLLPAIRTIANDPTVEESDDPREATVINVQRFRLDGNPTDFQQHGAHADRVDVTAVVCLDNVGEHGELVIVDGYSQACDQLSLDQDRDFNGNLQRILAHDPGLVEFKVHPVKAGSVVVLHSSDYHFITAKSLEDVKHGIENGHDPFYLDAAGQEVIGRAIVNMAFETEQCRQIHRIAESLIASHLQDTSKEDFFPALDAAIAAFLQENTGPGATAYAAKIRSAIVTQGTAARLYGKEDVLQSHTAQATVRKVAQSAIAAQTEA